MSPTEEKAAFAQRLRSLLSQSAKPIKGATDLARFFNLKCSAGQGISVQTAHKWLTGRSFPTSDKIELIAQWFGVTAHWLHHGPPPEDNSTPKASTVQQQSFPSYEILGLLEKIEKLPASQQHLVSELVSHLYGGQS